MTPRNPWPLALSGVGLAVLQLLAYPVQDLRPVAIGTWAVGAAVVTLPPGRRALGIGRVQLRWLIASSAVALVLGAVFWLLNLMTSVPEHPLPWFMGAAALSALTVAVSSFLTSENIAAWVVTHGLSAAAVVLLVVAVYLVLVVGINGSPEGHERDVLLSSLIAATTAAVLAPAVRSRVTGQVRSLLHKEMPTTGDVVANFGARMSRAVPMDELLLQLAESLREPVPGSRAEIWTGSAAALTRTVSVPHRPSATLSIDGAAATTIANSRIGGPGWVDIWLPAMKPEDEHPGDFRVVPVAHLGELLGLVAVYRPAEGITFSGEEDASLVELAYQLGLALHNVKLDSALQESLDQLAVRNRELQESRARVVHTADEARRTIERNLHDGAQQHLVALAVKLGLASAIAEDGDVETVGAMLGDLRSDVQETIQEVRNLAHGIYPPLLRDRGLSEALAAAGQRATLPTHVEVHLAGRYEESVETAAYFCTLEALQNAGKYAGDGATIKVEVTCDDDHLYVRIDDTGSGFDVATWRPGAGFTNMEDRLGAIGGMVDLDAAPGRGTTVSITIPARPLGAAA
ncbi:MAG: histidine kinase [Marmoricola sp.]